MTLNDLERCNNPYFAFFSHNLIDFAAQLRYSGNVCKVLSPSSSLPLLVIPNPPCSAVSLRQLSYLCKPYCYKPCKLSNHSSD